MQSISVSDLSFTVRMGFWREKTALLHQIGFEVPQGECCGILGRNGAGKTTLLKILVGIEKPSLGRSLIQGHDSWTPEAKCKIGYLPERPAFYPHLKAKDFLSYMGTLSGLSGKKLTTQIHEMLARVKLDHAVDRPLKAFSKGMLQRIGIAQALLHDPQVLFMDEPLSGLDILGKKQLKDLLVDLQKEGKSIVFTSHEPFPSEWILDQVLVLEKGILKLKERNFEFSKGLESFLGGFE